MRAKGVSALFSIRSIKDFWAGLIYVFIGSCTVIIARDYDMGTALKMGPAYFPTLLGYLLAFIGIISVARSFISQGAPIGEIAFKGLLSVIASVLLFGFLVRRAGLVVVLPLLVILSASASDHFRWRPTLILAAGLTLFCVFVFLRGLGVPLPIWGSWFGG
ncbi:MAG: tripartite tricarboxylate transporter TctB family protein [Candidatus Binatia bacterium]